MVQEKHLLFNAIAGIVKINSGKIIFQENEIHNLPIHKRANHGLAYLPQEPSLFNDLSVIENLNGISELSKQPNLMTVDEIIHTFNLKKIINKKGRELSGGQRRKTEIARTLIGNPKLLLLDEPFSGIDPIAVDEIKDLLSHIKTMGISILITDHNVRETLDICNQAAIINNGELIAEGDKKSLINNNLVKKGLSWRHVFINEYYSFKKLKTKTKCKTYTVLKKINRFTSTFKI